MTLFTKVATFAAMSLSLAGLISTSTPSRAAESTREVISAPALVTVQPVTHLAVPPAAIEIAPAATSDAEDFNSLAEAVAAQEAVAEDEAMRCLAGAIYFESKGEPLSGQLAVAQVVLNRAKSGRFPPDVCGVIKQRGQFGFVRGGQIPSINEAQRAYRTAIAVARVAMADIWDGAAETALYFNRPGRSPGRVQRIAAIGNHIFYR